MGVLNQILCRAADYANGISSKSHTVRLASAYAYLDAHGVGQCFFGAESIHIANRPLYYLNRGDTYKETVCCQADGICFVCSWGGWYEQAEQDHCESEGVLRCGYCSYFTPYDGAGDWREVVCGSCGNLVGG